MRIFRARRGPFTHQPHFSTDEFERIASDELRSHDLLPSSPQPIRIDRFIEKRFGSDVITYDQLDPGVLGYTRFGSAGVERIVVSRELADEAGPIAERRVNTTLAHEAGHGLLHADLFAADSFNQTLFGGSHDTAPGRVLCRDPGTNSGYDGRWWEYQANRMMASLLMPKALVLGCIGPLLEAHGSLGIQSLPAPKRAEAIHLVSATFEVNPAAARIRLDGLLPAQEGGQLTF